MVARRSLSWSPEWLWLIVAGTALIALLISVVSLDGTDLFFVCLAVLSAGVFVAAYLISSRQIDAALREEAILAKNQVTVLEAKLAGLKKQLADASQARSEHVLALEAQVAALTGVIREYLSARPDAATEDESVAALRDAAGDDESTGLEGVEALKTAADEAEAPVDASFTDLETTTKGLLPSMTALAAELPERHRLAGLWVAAGVALALLAFLSVANIDVNTSTSSTGSTGDSAANQNGDPVPVPFPWGHRGDRGPGG